MNYQFGERAVELESLVISAAKENLFPIQLIQK